LRFNQNFLQTSTVQNFFKSIKVDFEFDVIVVDGFYLMRSDYHSEEIPGYVKDVFFDEIGYENFINKISMWIICSNCRKERKLRMGLGIANKLSVFLKNKFPSEHFIVGVSANGSDCFVSFHKKREGQRLSVEDIEKYAGEAVLEIMV